MLLASLSLLLAIAVVSVVVLVAKSSRKRPAVPDVSGAAHPEKQSDSERDNRAARARAVAMQAVAASEPAGATAQRNSGNPPTRQILKDVGARIASRAGLRQPLETQVNNIADYLRGVLTAARAIDPSVLVALRDEYEGRLCGADAPPDLDVMVYAKLVTLGPEVASPRALNCALTRRDTEDIVLWSLLDAWNAGGRPPLPALSSIERSATDERTTRRLKTLQEQAEGLGGARPARPSALGRGPAEARLRVPETKQ
jgi:hypothetical protein